MRASIAASIVIVSVQQILAQDAITTSAPSLSPAEVSADDASGWSERLSSLSSLSSKVGTFYEDPVYLFMPGAENGDFVSAVGSGGPNAETTTWEVYLGWAVTYSGMEDWKSAYKTMTIGPTTYIESLTFHGLTVTDSTYFSEQYTQICSHTTIAPKISIPDSVWATQDFATLKPDNWPTYIGVCSMNGQSSIKDGANTIDKVETLTAMEAWRGVTVLGEAGALTASQPQGTGTASGDVAKETGSAPTATITGTEESKSTSTQQAGAAEVTAWVNAVVVVAGAAAFAI